MERAELLALLGRAKAEGWTELDLSWKGLEELPVEIGQLHNLRSLNLGGNQLSQLPVEIGQLHNLKTLALDFNQLSQLPAEIGQLKSLVTLELWSNPLSSLPAEISQLQNLSTLELCHNSLNSFPLEIIQLQNLKTLILGGKQITKLPPEIVNLKRLNWLSLTNANLIQIPIEIFQLKNLVGLHLNNNKLDFLPIDITCLQNLAELHLAYNQLNHIPTFIRELINLERLDLRGNPIPISSEILGLEEPGDLRTILDLYFSDQNLKAISFSKSQESLGNSSFFADDHSSLFHKIVVKIDKFVNRNQTLNMTTNITQNHHGSGDNVAGDKTVNNYQAPQTPEAAQQIIQELLKQLKIDEQTTTAKLQTQVTFKDLEWQQTLWAAFKNAGPELAKSAVGIALASAGLPGAIAAAAFNVVVEGVRGGLENRGALPPGDDENPFGEPSF
ncbi:MAG: leucine-rich repeat domain-containing protein [Limnothrix sp. BL-A-16]